MRVTFQTLGLLCLAVLAAGAWAAEQTAPAEGSQQEKFDWTAAIEKLDLQPARVKLLREAEAKGELATLRVGDTTAPTDFVPTNPDYVSFAKSGGPGCKLVDAGLVVGTEYYTDRTYKLVQVPEKFQGLTLLQTKNGHKSIVDGRYAIVVRSPGPCYCFVALDERAVLTYQESGMPSWLEEFSLTAYRIYTDDRNMQAAERGYVVLVRHVPGGKIALGPNAGHPKSNSMYFAFFGAASDSNP